MKRLILTILLLLIASPAYPFGAAMMAAASAGGAAACTGETEAQAWTGTADRSARYNAYWAFQFTAVDAGPVCKAVISMKNAAGTTPGNISVYFETDNGSNQPSGTPVGDESDTVAASTLTGDYANIAFTGFSASFTVSAKYFLIVKFSTVDADNYASFQESAYNASKFLYKSNDGSTWTLSTGSTLTGAIYK